MSCAQVAAKRVKFNLVCPPYFGSGTQTARHPPPLCKILAFAQLLHLQKDPCDGARNFIAPSGNNTKFYVSKG